jgi:hypothetical protein
MDFEVEMKAIPVAFLVIMAACQVSKPAPARRPLMDSAIAAKLCTNPGAVSVLGADCVMRDQSPPPRLLPARGLPK